jgi:hypothetical protein
MFGLTLEQYNHLLAQQGGVCGICGSTSVNSSRNKHFMVDHCHETGQIRGILCHTCNSGLGKLGDSIVGVRQALEYLLVAEARII